MNINSSLQHLSDFQNSFISPYVDSILHLHRYNHNQQEDSTTDQLKGNNQAKPSDHQTHISYAPAITNLSCLPSKPNMSLKESCKAKNSTPVFDTQGDSLYVKSSLVQCFRIPSLVWPTLDTPRRDSSIPTRFASVHVASLPKVDRV
jgi:hypothetical protein